MGTPRDSEKTRARIIDAAGELFAERGVNGVTVRDIAAKAETQISALNYHFRGKDALHREVLLEASRRTSFSEEDQQQLLQLAPEDALYVIISETLKLYRSQPTTNWENALLTRECHNAGPVFTEIAQSHFRPQTDFVAEIVARAVDKTAADPQVRFAVISLFSLLDSFGLYGSVIELVSPGLNEHLQQRKRLEKQIFSIIIETARAAG